MKLNKYQEALDRIKVHVPDYRLINNHIVEVNKHSDLCKLQELIDKEAPMKRTITNGRPYCPKCSYSLLIQDVWEMSYCCACGQRIDWSDEE